MIIITKNIIAEMYSSSDNQESGDYTHKIVANTIKMKTVLENNVELQINVFSHYIKFNDLNELIYDDETDVNKIFDEVSFIDETFEIDCDEEFTLEKDAEEYLLELHKDFCDTQKEYDLEMIEYKIQENKEIEA